MEKKKATVEEILDLFWKFKYKPNFKFAFEAREGDLIIAIESWSIPADKEEYHEEVLENIRAHESMHREQAPATPLWMEHHTIWSCSTYIAPLDGQIVTLDDWSLHLERLVLDVEVRLARSYMKWDGVSYPEYAKREGAIDVSKT